MQLVLSANFSSGWIKSICFILYVNLLKIIQSTNGNNVFIDTKKIRNNVKYKGYWCTAIINRLFYSKLAC